MSLAFGGGISLYASASVIPAAYATAAALLAIVAIACRCHRRIAICAVGASLALAGLAWAQVHRFYAPADSAIHSVTEQPVLLRARMVIAEQPADRAASLPGRRAVAVRAKLTAIEHGRRWANCSGDVLLRIEPAGDLRLAPGQQITAIGELSRITSPMNPGEYDWQAHFAREGLFMRMRVGEPAAIRIETEAPFHFLWWARQATRQALSRGFVDEPTRALAAALLLGDSSDSLEETWADFRASGTAHHLSISGTHIAILTGFVLLIGRLLLLHPRSVLIGAAAFAVLYSSITHISPPVVRSILLCLTLAGSVLLRRNTDPLQCLFVAVLLMLLYNPMDLTSPGFQLSFGAVAALMLLTGRIVGWFWSLENEHDRIARTIRPPHGASAYLHSTLRAFVQAIAAGTVAYCVSLPLVAIHFRQINPWAIPGSLILAPFVIASLALGLVKIAVSAIIPSAAGVVAVPAEAVLQLMRGCVGLLAQLPGAQLGVFAVSPWMVAAYAALLVCPLLPRLQSWRFRWVLPVAAVTLFTGSAFLPASHPEGARITFLSVGNGSCCVIETPDGRVTLVDCGASGRPDLYERTISPFLRARGIAEIDAVIITHTDLDHTLALPDVLREHNATTYDDLPPGHVPGLSGDMRFEVLSPTGPRDPAANDASLVVLARYAGRSILFTGDIEATGIDALLRSGRLGPCDLLVAPHHGSFEENTADLLAACKPAWVICSSSAKLSGAQRQFQGLVSSSAALYRTGVDGSITVTITPEGALDVRGYRK